jgi:hypothetical protein
MDSSRLDGEQPPPPRSGHVTQSGTATHIQQRGDELSPDRQDSVTKRVDAAVAAAQPGIANPAANPCLAGAGVAELLASDHALLRLSDPPHANRDGFRSRGERNLERFAHGASIGALV